MPPAPHDAEGSSGEGGRGTTDLRRGESLFATFFGLGLPGAALLPGVLLILGGFPEMPWELPGGWMLLLLLTASAVIVAGTGFLRGATDATATSDGDCGVSPGPRAEYLTAVIVLSAAILCIGLKPGLVLHKSDATIASILGVPWDPPD